MNNESAFPIVIAGDESFVREKGMRLRDYFAGQALQGFCANINGIYDLRYNDGTINTNELLRLTEMCYAVAEIMLSHRG